MAFCEKILMVGPSGAGKSSLLQELRPLAPPHWALDDLDRLLLAANPQWTRLADLISAVGWQEFRLKEQARLEQWLQQDASGILALGGGALTADLWQQFRSSNEVRFCLVNASFADCWQRLQSAQLEPRPLLELGAEVSEKIYWERQQLFGQIPWVLANPAGSKLADLAKQFWSQLLLDKLPIAE